MTAYDELSSAAFLRDGSDAHEAMVGALEEAMVECMAQPPAFRLGFLLPLAELIECHRLNVTTLEGWSGVKMVQAWTQSREVARG